jgi:hypothetical protein
LPHFGHFETINKNSLSSELRFVQHLYLAQLKIALWRGVRLPKRGGFFLAILIFASSMLIVSPTKGYDSFKLNPVTENHVAKLNSNLPYLAGFHVDANDLSLREQVNATAVTISFPSTGPEYFPSSCWLGGGMFVQAQDHVFRNVDYGFYMMLVLDATGTLFIDLGLHQTEEATAPNHTCRSDIVYAYTWQITGIERSAPVTLLQSWNSNGSVNYLVSVSGQNRTLATVNVVCMPNCQNIIEKFYAGNVVMSAFPFSLYINYFQFGVISSQILADSHWQVDVKEPKMLRRSGWVLVDKAWLLEGDHSYLDSSLMWGGATYPGVVVQYYHHPLEKPSEVIFYYDGQTLTPGKVLWDISSTSNSTTALYGAQDQSVTMFARRTLTIIIILFSLAFLVAFLLVRRRRLRNLARVISEYIPQSL